MKKQVVVRTAPPNYNFHWYDKERMKYLSEKLEDGYVVVMCNPIGKDLEYILEKQISEVR